MPLKREVVPLLDSPATSGSGATGVCNTVLLEPDGSRHGLNTDVTGALMVLGEHDGPLGAGRGPGRRRDRGLGAAGAGRARDAARHARGPRPGRAAEETVRVVPAHRAAPDGRGARDRRASRRALAADVLVSTVPASAQVPELLAAVADVPLVFDVVYEPWPTPLAAAAERSGRTVLSGLDLLVAQAVNQVVAMTGRFDVPVGRDAPGRRGGAGVEVGRSDRPLPGHRRGRPASSAWSRGRWCRWLIGRLPEPEPEAEPEPEDAEAAEPETEPEEPKELYADIAALPGLALEGGAGRRRVGAAAIGLALGWSWSLLVRAAAGAGLGGAGGHRLADPAAAHPADRAGVRRDRRDGPARLGSRTARGHATTWCGPRSAWLVAGGVVLRAVVHLPARHWATATSGCPACSGSPWATSAGRAGSSGIYGGFLLGGVDRRAARPAARRGPQGLPVRPVHARRAPSWASSSDSRVIDAPLLLRESPDDVALADRG